MHKEQSTKNCDEVWRENQSGWQTARRTPIGQGSSLSWKRVNCTTFILSAAAKSNRIESILYHCLITATRNHGVCRKVKRFCVVNKILSRRQRATRILRPFVTNRLRKYEIVCVEGLVWMLCFLAVCRLCLGAKFEQQN
jgi:hypothetical protein